MGKSVILCGEISLIEVDKVTIQTSDKGSVTVVGGAGYEGKFVEVWGVPTGPNTLQETQHVNLSDNFGEGRSVGACRGVFGGVGARFQGAAVRGMLCSLPRSWRPTSTLADLKMYDELVQLSHRPQYAAMFA